MKYLVRVNKKVSDRHVYNVLKKTEGNVNFLTKIFMKIFAGRSEEKEEKLGI